MDFLLDWNFDQTDRAFSPRCPTRFDPEIGSQLEMRFEIKVVLKVPVPLQQAEPLGVLVRERRMGEGSDREVS